MTIDTVDDGSELDSPDEFVDGMKGARPAPALLKAEELYVEDGAKPAPPFLAPPVAEDTIPAQLDRVDPSASRAETDKQAGAPDSDGGD